MSEDNSFWGDILLIISINSTVQDDYITLKWSVSPQNCDSDDVLIQFKCLSQWEHRGGWGLQIKNKVPVSTNTPVQFQGFF